MHKECDDYAVRRRDNKTACNDKRPAE